MKKSIVQVSITLILGATLTGCAWFGMGSDDETTQRTSNDPLVMKGELQQKNTDSQSASSNTNQNASGNHAGQQSAQGPTLRQKSSNSTTANSDQQTPKIQPELNQQPRKTAGQLASEGKAAHENGDYAKAIEKYKQAIQKDSSQSGYYFNLGSLYYTQKNYQQARNHYQQTIRIKNDHKLAHLYLGATYLELGNRSSARNHFNRVLEIDPNNQKAQQYLNQL